MADQGIESQAAAAGVPAAAVGIRIGSLRPASRYSLAPLAGYTNYGFRRAVRELGGLGLATTDLISSKALLIRSRKTMELLHTCPADRPLVVQIYGTVAEEMRDAARWLEGYGASAVDINMGCPVHKVTRGGGGSAMLCDVDNTVRLVRTIVEGVRIPVTVKMRLGWDDRSLSAPFFARAFEQAGVAAITIHGRTREQGFGGTVSLDGIRAVVEAVERIPVLGNGDVRTIEDAMRMRAVTGCAGVAIGRGAPPEPVDLRPARSLGGDRDARPVRNVRAAARLHAPPLPPADRRPRRAARGPDIPQGGQLVLPRAPPGSRLAATHGPHRQRARVRRDRGDPARARAASGSGARRSQVLDSGAQGPNRALVSLGRPPRAAPPDLGSFPRPGV